MSRRAACKSFGLILGLRRRGLHVAAFPSAAAWPCQHLGHEQQQRQQQHGQCGHLSLPWAIACSRQLHTPLSKSSVTGTQSLLDSIQAAKLRDDLSALSDEKPYITYPELLEFIKQHNAADCDSEAEERADALTRAGVILRLNSIVYLRPQEVAEMVHRVVPTDPEEARRRLADTEQELAHMEAQHMAIQRAAHWWPRFWLRMGCVGLFVQLCGFAYMIWWELSWDVMEPVSYMVGLTYSFIAYVYFLSKGSELDFGPFLNFWTGQQLRKKMQEKGFDLDRYQSLMRQSERYRRYLAAQAAAERAGNRINQ